MLSVIFVEPESPGNIGSIARCMKNFGAETLILVNPCSLKGAQKIAMHAQDIVEKAAITNTLSDALKLVDTSIATTSKPGGLLREAITPGELTHISGDVGIVIGRESSGLTNAEIDKCDFLISIPTSEEYPAMNASSACCIILYEFFKCREKIERKIMNRKRIMEEFIRISELIEKRQHRKRIWKIVMNRILTRAFLSERESTVLLGIFRRIRTVLEATP